jgi:hypothetical protein
MELYFLTVNLLKIHLFFQGRDGKLVTYSYVLFGLLYKRILICFHTISKYGPLDKKMSTKNQRLCISGPSFPSPYDNYQLDGFL